MVLQLYEEGERRKENWINFTLVLQTGQNKMQFFPLAVALENKYNFELNKSKTETETKPNFKLKEKKTCTRWRTFSNSKSFLNFW